MNIQREEVVVTIRLFKTLWAIVLATSFAFATSAAALCDQTSASQADKDLWASHGCQVAYFKWQAKAYDIRSGAWENRGYKDACNQNLEYPKHWNAAYLVTYGLADNNSQSFHGTVDYRAIGEAASSKFHDHLHHIPTDETGIFGGFSDNTVRTSCALYDASSANANPGSRGGDFVHEGWHAYFQKYNFNNGNVGGHRPMQGNCTIKGCDYFYFHGVGAYAFGDMWQNNGTASRFHSPNQAQVEYLCDVADQPQAWVPNSVRTAAENDANTRAVERFINGPGYRCGDPRPW